MQDSLLQSVLNTQNINKAILLVEDSDEDFAAFSRMLGEAAFFNPVYRTCDGDDALDYLYHQGEYADPATSPRPAIILIDLNLPGTDGREVIEQVKQDEALKSIPIVVFTTSSSPKDIKSCYQYGVNCYMLKPIGVEALRKTVRIFLDYWFKTAILPNSTQ